MKWSVLIPLLFWAGWMMAATQMSIQGAKVKVTGAYLAINPRIVTVIVSTSTTGQCLGILCGVTHPD